MVQNEISLIVSSNPSNGAKNVNSTGSYFEVDLDDSLDIPRDALNVNMAVEEATVWWTVPNIITGVNDKLYITGPNTSDVTTAYTVTIPQGLYDLSGLSQAVLRDLENQGAKISPSALITLAADEPTQKVEIIFNYAVVEIDFTQADTPREIIGFDSAIYGPYAGAPETVLAPNVANFNTVNYFLIKSDLTTKGIRFNNSHNQTISQVLIDVSPGSQIVSKPFNPPRVSAQELAGSRKSLMKFWLTDDSENLVDTNGEYWTARIVIRYLRPHIITGI